MPHGSPPIPAGGVRLSDVRRLAPLALLAVVALGCTSTPRTATNFCRLIERHRDTLVLLPTSADAVGAVAERYAELLEVAPLAVEQDWAVLTDLMAAAAAVDANDPEAVEDLIQRSLLAERSAKSASNWVLETCGVDLAGG